MLIVLSDISDHMKYSQSMQNKQEQLEGIVTILIEEVENITEYLQNGSLFLLGHALIMINRHLFGIFELQYRGKSPSCKII